MAGIFLLGCLPFSTYFLVLRIINDRTKRIAKEKREVERQLAEANAERHAVVDGFEAERSAMHEKLQHMEDVMAMMKAKGDDDERVMDHLHAKVVEVTAERDELKDHLKQELKVKQQKHHQKNQQQKKPQQLNYGRTRFIF
jgi:DNA repair ATPase RecN